MISDKITILTGLFLALSVPVSATDYQVEDPHLANCLTQLAQDNHWQSASEFLEIVCHSQRIQSVAGIDKFVNISRLSLHNNQITSISLDNFPQLTHLNLARNNLTEVTIARLPELTEVFLFRNRLAAATLEDLPKLKEVNANANRLTRFSYSNLPIVEKIYLFNNELEHVDINNLPSLQYMDARQNPMPDKLYEEMNALPGVTILHDGNADDW
jgi:Leucine-rich repeat (LRR) protein